MSLKPIRRFAVVLAFLGPLFCLDASAAPLTLDRFFSEAEQAVGRLLLERLPGASARKAPAKARCGIDPDGRLVCSDSPVTPKHRCGIDPNGTWVCTP